MCAKIFSLATICSPLHLQSNHNQANLFSIYGGKSLSAFLKHGIFLVNRGLKCVFKGMGDKDGLNWGYSGLQFVVCCILPVGQHYVEG